MKTKKNHKKNHSTRKHIVKNFNEKTMMKIMEKEVSQIAKTTDLSKVSIEVFVDDLTKTIRIPKPVFTIATLDINVMNWLIIVTNEHPDYAQIFC